MVKALAKTRETTQTGVIEDLLRQAEIREAPGMLADVRAEIAQLEAYAAYLESLIADSPEGPNQILPTS